MRGRLLGFSALTLTSFLWGTTGTAATFAPQAGPLAIGAAALGVGGLLQAAIAIGSLRHALPLLAFNARTVAAGSVAVAVYPLAFYSSMHFAGVAIGSVVSLASAPLASGLLERLVDRTRLNRWWVAAAGLGTVGSTLLCMSKMDGQESVSPTSMALGLGLGLVAGATYAAYSWTVHRLMGKGITRAAAMGSVFGCGGVLLLPVLAVTAAPLAGSTDYLLVAGYMALIPMFVGYVLFGIGLTQINASTATTITLIEPAVATVLAVVIVGERLTRLGWAGLTTIGLVLVVLVLAPTNIRRVRAVPRTRLQ